ncbi:cwl1 [Sporothrix schenckii 1099-18]|uniref:Reticulon-like protein n=2 Tax=Sporothrix schenckii TaxID=29908 RepID=U7PJI2_SPOS1|nr:cwl1 [Sporothrix schenckii 1099-18]ERS95076.1 hypothetical protein HMPREF1624_08565 [Sporothrix schenckii ATCC 58251]KJR87309.1 cwl1 [Sporothrix schenckii 1099-18]
MADTAGYSTNGGVTSPIATAAKGEAAKTSSEFNKLANARQTPSTPAATGQPLTHYHSFFSELLSWNNPRASGIAYASIVAFIFAVRYLDVIRWGLRLTWMILGVTVAAETAGKLVLNKGLASQIRPRTYYTLPRQALDNVLGDVHELLNFFVIEAQRIVYAENVAVSAAACVAAFLSYYLVKIVPYWGLALIGTSIAFIAPLIYKTNKELIDAQVKNVSDLVGAQTSQLRDVANKHTAHATEVTKQYMGDYTAKAQQLLGGRSAPVSVPTPAASKPAPADTKAAPFASKSVPVAKPVTVVPAVVATAPSVPTTEPVTRYEETDFPTAPKVDLNSQPPKVSAEEPLVSL